jgi:hypothetical protein
MRKDLNQSENAKPNALYLIELRAHFARLRSPQRQLIAKISDFLASFEPPKARSIFADQSKDDTSSVECSPTAH